MAQSARKSTALWVLRRLREAGYEALFAGGCVRDMLLGRRCSDYDIATDATPEQVRDLFRRVLLVGAKFGVAMVLRRGEKVEVTTFRTDLSYEDGRRPTGVRFSSAREDALRRDFTINGMFHDPIAHETIDYVGGQEDLARRTVRTIGDADERFAEDYLRMLRAVRFAETLEFEIDPGTADAIRRHADRITSISGERIHDEMQKMLSQPTAHRALNRLQNLGLLSAVLPELFAEPHQYPRAYFRLEDVAKHRDFILGLGAVLCDLRPRSVGRVLRRWGASNELRDALRFLGDNLSLWEHAAELPLCEFKRLMQSKHFELLCRLWRAEEKLNTSGTKFSRRARKRAEGIPPDAVSPPPLLTGRDLQEMGLSEGPAVGRVLKQVRDQQLNEEISTPEQARVQARRRMRELGLG